MKTFISLLFVLISAAGSLQAQDRPMPPGPPPGPEMDRGEKIEALYVAYITRELALTEEDAQKFWPVHSQYDNELKALKLDMPELDRQQAVLNIKKKYQDKFIKVLGSQRTDEFYRKDAEFRKKMLEKLQQMKERKGMKDNDNRMRRRPA